MWLKILPNNYHLNHLHKIYVPSNILRGLFAIFIYSLFIKKMFLKLAMDRWRRHFILFYFILFYL